MSAPSTPSKRPLDENCTESDENGKSKRQKPTGSHSQNLPINKSRGGFVFRMLCHASKVGCVIGKGGAIVSQIRQKAGVKVRVEETVSGCDERIVVISESDRENEVEAEQGKDEDTKDENVEENNEEEKEADGNEQSKNEKEKDPVPKDNAGFGEGIPSVQKALLLVFERMVAGEPGPEGGDEGDESSTFVLRLLVFSNQVGCILGKGGSVIKQMSSDSGAQIRILPRDKLPSCAAASDELVQISGGVEAVRKALQSVSQQLLDNPPRDNDHFSANTTVQSSHSFWQPPSKTEGRPLNYHSFSSQGVPCSGPPLAHKYYESGGPGQMKPPIEILSFRLLCPDERAGGVIGKGGTIIKSLKQETGCEIKVMEAVPDSEDRIIIISGPAHPEDRISVVQDAILRVQSRIFRAIPDSKEQSVLARLLVSSNQIGCLLGKGGSIIAEMRKSSGAHIRILGKDQVPKCAKADEEVVQINGDFEAVQEAILQITTRLQHHFFRDLFPSINYPTNPAFSDQVPVFSSYGVRREFSPQGRYSNLGPSFHIDGGLHPHDDRTPFMHEIHRPGAPPHISDRKPWGSRGLVDGGGSLGLPDFAGAPHRRNAGFGGGNQPPIITSTTIEVFVPHNIVPVIYGEDGECLKQIRQISDARITITEPKPEAVETVIIISGTPEQTHAAQSLIQAFVMSETESS